MVYWDLTEDGHGPWAAPIRKVRDQRTGAGACHTVLQYTAHDRAGIAWEEEPSSEAYSEAPQAQDGHQ